jgi:hypothetical protein
MNELKKSQRRRRADSRRRRAERPSESNHHGFPAGDSADLLHPPAAPQPRFRLLENRKPVSAGLKEIYRAVLLKLLRETVDRRRASGPGSLASASQWPWPDCSNRPPRTKFLIVPRKSKRSSARMTVLDDFTAWHSCKKIYYAIEELQADLGAWLGE